MTYYAGKNLENRVRDFGLEELQTILTSVAEGSPWPGTYQIIPFDAEQLEPIRVTVYSLLQQTRTKPMFRVRVQLNRILVEQKSARSLTQAGIILPGQAQVSKPGEVYTEDLSHCFDETKPDWMSHKQEE